MLKYTMSKIHNERVMKVKVCLLIGLLVSCVFVHASVDLTSATIVLPDVPAAGERVAAEDLAYFFRVMTGRRYPIVRESEAAKGGAKVFLGRTRAAREAGIDVEKLSAQSFRWLTRDGFLFVVGGSPSGTGFGVNRLLGAAFGCYQFDYDFHSAPKRSVLTVPELNVMKSPKIRNRYIHTWNRAKWMTADYAAAKTNVLRRNFLLLADEDRTEPGLRETQRLSCGAHTYYDYIPPEKFGVSHPEWYSMDSKGVRGPSKGPDGQLCLTNPDMRREACRHLTEIATADMSLQEGLRPNLYDLSQRDTCYTHLCWCTNCLWVWCGVCFSFNLKFLLNFRFCHLLDTKIFQSFFSLLNHWDLTTCR